VSELNFIIREVKSLCGEAVVVVVVVVPLLLMMIDTPTCPS